MNNNLEMVSLEDRVDNFIEKTRLKEEAQAKLKKQQDRVMILQEKDIVKSLMKHKDVAQNKMKKFFKLGVGAGIATLGLAQVAPVIAVVAAVGVGYSIIKSMQKLKETKSIEEDVKVAKKNVNTMLATLQGGKAGVYKITSRIAECRKMLNIQEISSYRLIPKYK